MFANMHRPRLCIVNPHGGTGARFGAQLGVIIMHARSMQTKSHLLHGTAKAQKGLMVFFPRKSATRDADRHSVVQISCSVSTLRENFPTDAAFFHFVCMVAWEFFFIP
jgi:hypothetical protein